MDGEMLTLSEMGLRHGGRVEVELVFSIQISVLGKGSTYRKIIEVGPNEKMDVIRNRVHFFHMFSARNYQVVNLKDNRIFENDDLNTLLFRDSNLKSGDELTLKEPEKKKGPVKESTRVNSGQIADPEGNDENMQREPDEDVSLDSYEKAIALAQEGIVC